jgi:hypothetical protein
MEYRTINALLILNLLALTAVLRRPAKQGWKEEVSEKGVL